MNEEYVVSVLRSGLAEYLKRLRADLGHAVLLNESGYASDALARVQRVEALLRSDLTDFAKKVLAEKP